MKINILRKVNDKINKIKISPIAFSVFLFVLISIRLIYLIPYNRAPDEYNHFECNVLFIIENHRLPICGVDDIDRLSAGFENGFGQVSGAYSYNVSPQINYLISAAFAVVLNKLTGCELYLGARWASLFWGILFFYFIYKISLKITNNKNLASLISSSIMFIPQVIHISVYINQDIHSLAIASMVFYSLLNIIEKYNKKSLFYFAVACGLLPSAKLNYLIIAPFIACYLFWLTFIKKKLDYKIFIKISLSVFISAILISGFWYVRNFYLYKDFIGNNYMLSQMEKYQPLGVKQELNLSTLRFILANGGYFTLFKTFFTGFGYLTIEVPEALYYILMCYIAIGALRIFLLCIEKRDTVLLSGFSWLLIMFCGIIFMIIINSINYDYQFQGRYAYAILVPIVIYLSIFIPKYGGEKFVQGFLGIMIVFMVISFKGLILNYGDCTIQSYRTQGASQEENGDNVIIDVGEEVSQSFTADKDWLTRITFQISTIKNINNVQAKVILIDSKTNETVCEKNIIIDDIINQDMVNIDFFPIKESKGTTYKVIWKNLSANDIIILRGSSVKLMEGGELFVNDLQIDKDIAFTTWYRNENYISYY